MIGTQFQCGGNFRLSRDCGTLKAKRIDQGSKRGWAGGWISNGLIMSN